MQTSEVKRDFLNLSRALTRMKRDLPNNSNKANDTTVITDKEGK